VALLCTQLLMMSSSVKARADASLLETWVVGLTSPIVTLAHWVGDGVRGSWNWTAGLLDARARNEELQAEVVRLRAELREQREATLENTRLRDLLDMRREMVPDSIGASVVTANLSGNDRVLVIDRGTNDGVKVDLPVVARGGVVGKVVATFPSRAKVRLITDPNSGAAGLVQRSRAKGIVFGTGGDQLDLHYVARFSDVVPGDRVVTSAADGIFPRGFGIGTVSSVVENSDGTQVIVLDPEVDYSTLEEVLVLRDSSGGGISPPDLEEPR
jgi:rod shape-determining protein MreC